jgi:hypothetical protein
MGDGDQDDEELQPVASSTSDATSGTRREACQRSAPSCPCWELRTRVERVLAKITEREPRLVLAA